MIEVKNISKSFGDKLVLDDLSIIFEEGKTRMGMSPSALYLAEYLKKVI
jgi:ABC-type enterochelin transport system ATPase subunit